MKVCDLTQFYSPTSGGVKKYIAEKVRYLREQTIDDEHILIIPGDKDERIESDRSRTYTIKSPLVSRTSRYRALLRLGAIEEILEAEHPDLIESGDPYQVAWQAIHSGSTLRTPVIGFYHSHFPEAYLRSSEKYLGRYLTEIVFEGARRYVRKLYNRFQRTIVPSPVLARVLTEWGVTNSVAIDLGVDATVFRPEPNDRDTTRSEYRIPLDRTLLLYIGRLAQEKNTHTLFAAFQMLVRQFPDRFYLSIVGDGLQRANLERLRAELSFKGHSTDAPIHWIPYCSEPWRLAQLYRAADLFVHPGVQETFGLVALEAQACGTPVIGIRGSYMDRIIHSDQTLWAKENSASALASAIEETASAPRKDEAHLLHDRVSSQYSWTQTFRQLFQVYREVVCDYTARMR